MTKALPVAPARDKDLPIVVKTVDEKNIACKMLHFLTYGNVLLLCDMSDNPP